MKDILIKRIITSHYEDSTTITLQCSCINEDNFDSEIIFISIDCYEFLLWFDKNTIDEIKNKLIENIKKQIK